MTRHDPRRAGAARSEVVLVIAAVALTISALMPTLRARSVQMSVDEAATDVATFHSAVEEYFASTGSWPAPSEPGELPPEVAYAFPGHGSLTHADYSLEWSLLEVPGNPRRAGVPTGSEGDTAPDSLGGAGVHMAVAVGGLTVHSGNDALLADLLSRYGSRASFARDSTWTLIVGMHPQS